MTEPAKPRPYLACVVSPDGEAWWSLITTLQELKDDVGAERIDKAVVDLSDTWGVYAWVGDSSLRDGLPTNRAAVELRDALRAAGGQSAELAPLCGYVVFAAFDRQSGAAIHLPLSWRQALGPGGRFGWVTELPPVSDDQLS